MLCDTIISVEKSKKLLEKVLIVDDDAELRSELRDFLEGYDVVEASRGEDALRLLKRANDIGVVILDVVMPGVSGLDVLTEIKKMDPDLGIIILTGHSSKDMAIRALKCRADDYVEKPLYGGKIREAVEKLMESRDGRGDMSVLDLGGKVEKIKRFVEKNRYKKIGLEEAANAVCLSPKYLSRVFKEYTRTGFTDYKLAVKIKGAKTLLSKTSCNINQIAAKLGYENAESFIRQFKRSTGYTPTGYRKRTKKKR